MAPMQLRCVDTWRLTTCNAGTWHVGSSQLTRGNIVLELSTQVREYNLGRDRYGKRKQDSCNREDDKG